MSKRISVVLTDEEGQFVRAECERLGSQSNVIRHAVDLLRKEKMIAEMSEHFASEAPKKRSGTEKMSLKALKKLPGY